MKVVTIMIRKDKQLGSKGQWAQSVRLKHWNLTAGCHSVAFFCTSSPPHQLQLQAENYLIPKLAFLMKTWLCTYTRANLLFSFLSLPPILVCFSHCAMVTWASLLFLKLAGHDSEPLHWLFPVPGIFCSRCIHCWCAPSLHSTHSSDVTFSERPPSDHSS